MLNQSSSASSLPTSHKVSPMRSYTSESTLGNEKVKTRKKRKKKEKKMSTGSNSANSNSSSGRSSATASTKQEIFHIAISPSKGSCQNGQDGCSCTRQFLATGACTHQFLNLIFCVSSPANGQICTHQLISLIMALLLLSFWKQT